MTYTREQINEMLSTNDQAVARAIIRLFTMQNADEQQWGTTNAQNGRGFCSSDARAGTRFARWLQGMDNKNVVRYAKKSLNNPKAMGIFGKYCKGGEDVMGRARRIALKHSQQLVDYANNSTKHAAAAAAGGTQTIHIPKVDKPVQSDVWYQNKPASERKPFVRREATEPPAGSYAATARIMAEDDDSGFDWDLWKEEMKERDM